MTTTFVILSIHKPSLGHVRYHTKFGPDRLSRISKTFSWKFFFCEIFVLLFREIFAFLISRIFSIFSRNSLKRNFAIKRKIFAFFASKRNAKKNEKIFVNRLSIFAENLCSNPSWTSFMVFFNNFCYFLFYF